MIKIPSAHRFPRLLPPTAYNPAARLQTDLASVPMGLRFTEWLLLGSLVVAYLFCISMPVFGVPLQVTSLRHFPLILLALAVTLNAFGMLLNSYPAYFSSIWSACWPLMLMAIYVTCGSLFGKYIYDTRDSFLTFGLYLFLFPAVAAVPALSGNPNRWVWATAFLWVTAALAALAGAAARLPATQSLHEIEYLMMSAFVLMWFLAKSKPVKLVALLLMFAAAGLNHKLTGYIVLILALLYIVFETGWRRVDVNWRGFYIITTFLTFSLVMVALTIGYFQFQSVLPTGSPEVRLNQYTEALKQFVASPIWGSAYTESSGEDFRESTRLYNIPTHSDVLDMLKHGGLIAFGLFAWGYWKIFSLYTKAIAATTDDRIMRAYFVSMRFFQISALVTFSLNPLLLKGPYLLAIWGNLGLASGLALMQLRHAGRKP